tara:strand:- start:1132 stop:1356 length:225 start_codon:yes stop_codon:yes gene_type:complete
MSKKNKSEKFKELARSRVNRAINMIRLIANLGNKSNYDYTPEQARKILNALQSEISNVRIKFNSKKRGTEEFSL